MGQLYIKNMKPAQKSAGNRSITSPDSYKGMYPVKKILISIIMFLIGLSMIAPFIWMISASLKIESEVFAYPVQWIPANPKFSNYAEVWSGKYPFYIFYKNSFVVTFFSIIGQLFSASLAAYAFARLNFRGRDILFMMYIATMMIPPQVTIIPKFIIFNWMNLIDNQMAIIIQSIVSVFGVFLLRQFFLSIPFELSESAYIDGAGDLRIWWQIILPLAKPAISSLTILFFVWTWNDYLTPLIYLRSKSKLTIPVALDFFMDEVGTKYALIMAGAVLATLPLVVVYFIGQKYFIESIATSGIK